MAKLIYACSRRGAFGAQTEAKLRRICATLTPDNIRGRTEPTVRVGANSAFAVTNASAGLMEDGWSVMLGRLYEEGDAAWAAPRSPFPDGSYAIVRASDDAVEVVSDPAGSRTIWRYMDDDVFVAATSQRAIVAFVGGLEFNRATIPWFLSTGTLGPELSWDRRLTRLQPESSVILDRRAWRLDDGPRTKIAFSAVERSPREHEAALRDALLGTARSLRGLDWTKWALPLSGGYDSRGILCLLKDHVGIPDDFRAITWGLKSSLTERGNDAMVARQLAERMGVR
ncbi:MAG: hypothetical protein FJX72_14050, partial [Armatimonadetes bacterium]|nr:hypothetical protein [Armatimonadota bacterium]